MRTVSSAEPAASLRTALLLVNRASGQMRQSDETPRLAAQLRARGFRVIEPEIADPGQIGDVVRSASADADLIVMGGGDGTLNAAAAALVERGLPVGILPLGTANDLARTLGIPAEIESALDVIAGGQVLPIDLGMVNGRFFFNVASLGISSTVSARLSGEAKQRWGVLSYGLTLLESVRETRPFRVRLRCDGEQRTFRAIQLTIGNGRHYGGGMTVDKQASISDGYLHLFVLRPQTLWRLVWFFPDLYRGRHDTWEGVSQMNGRHLVIETDRSLDINTDGELTTRTPAEVSIAPRALSIYVPEGTEAERTGHDRG